MKTVRYFSMFTGIGGFELGLLRAQHAHLGEKPQPQKRSQRRLWPFNKPELPILSRNITPLCVGYSEIDKYSIQTYEKHFKEHTNYGDATKIEPKELPDFELLVGGFPCQAFSIAGKRKGFDDTRGTLFFDIARILAEKRPRHLVLENVKGLLSHDSGKTFQTILGVLADLGYRVEWQVLNSKDFGVPQNRERVFIIGHLRDECGEQVLPIARNSATATQIHPTIDANYHKGYSQQRKLLAFPSRQDSRQKEAFPDANKQHRGSQTTPRIRRLTPKECERLQGFPDNWTDLVSDTQRYKQCGNAVTVNTVQAVIENLKTCLETEHNEKINTSSETIADDWSNPDWKYTIEKTHPFSTGTQKLAALLRRVRRGQANAQTYEDI